MPAELIMEGVTVGYHPGPPVLRELSVAATPGKMLAVTGSSGAGKTTLLRTLAGLLRPESGSVTLDPEVGERLGRAVTIRDGRVGAEGATAASSPSSPGTVRCSCRPRCSRPCLRARCWPSGRTTAGSC